MFPQHWPNGMKIGISMISNTVNIFTPIFFSIFSRSPTYTRHPKEKLSEKEENKINEEKEMKKPKVCRHLILIRHGQYHLDGMTDTERKLTQLGR